MDAKKIGSFLEALRTEQAMTQEQLGEKLGVSNKTVSRWENGNYLPPVEILQLLSDLYGLTINEILSAQRLTPAQYQEKAEENLKSVMTASSFTLNEKVTFYKRKWKKDHFAEGLCMRILMWVLLVIGIFTHEQLWNVAFVVSNVVYYLVERNEMMKYVEDRAYDGTGNDDRRE